MEPCCRPCWISKRRWRGPKHASGVIPADAAAAITEAAVAEGFDTAELVRQSLRAGTPAIPLVRMLTERVRARNEAAAGFVHWGATSQDVTDTALVLLLGQLPPSAGGGSPSRIARTAADLE